jgi:hypothetical protein
MLTQFFYPGSRGGREQAGYACAGRRDRPVGLCPRQSDSARWSGEHQCSLRRQGIHDARAEAGDLVTAASPKGQQPYHCIFGDAAAIWCTRRHGDCRSRSCPKQTVLRPGKIFPEVLRRPRIRRARASRRPSRGSPLRRECPYGQSAGASFTAAEAAGKHQSRSGISTLYASAASFTISE